MDAFEATVDLRLVDEYLSIIKDPDPRVRNLKVLISYNYFKGQRSILLRLQKEKKITSSFLDAGTYGMNPNGEN